MGKKRKNEKNSLKILAVGKNTLPLQPHLEKCSLKRICGNSSVGRARPCQGRGREFESRLPLNVLNKIQ